MQVAAAAAVQGQPLGRRQLKDDAQAKGHPHGGAKAGHYPHQKAADRPQQQEKPNHRLPQVLNRRLGKKKPFRKHQPFPPSTSAAAAAARG